MTRLNEKLIKEQYEKAERYFRVHDNYCPNYRRSAVTSKFYSRVDALDLSTADDELVRKIKIFRDKGPKNKFAWPETENMRYGWFSEPLVRFDRNDERLYFPVREDETTRHDIKLVNDKSMKLEKFGGVPFKLK